MIDVKCYVTETGVHDTSLRVVSNTLDLDYTVENQYNENLTYDLYDSQGRKIVEFDVQPLYTEQTSNSWVQNDPHSVTVNFFGDNDIAFDFSLGGNVSLTTNLDQSDYILAGSNMLGLYRSGSASAVIDTSKFYVYHIDDSPDLIIDYYESNTLIESKTIDTSSPDPLEGFFHSLYFYVNASSVSIEYLTPYPFYFVFNATTDLVYSLDIDGLTFSATDRSFHSLRDLVNANDNFSMIYEDLNGSPYYVVDNTSGSFSTGGSSGGSSGSCTLDQSILDQIKNEIDTSISTYFQNHPLDVSNVQITSVVDDVNSALNSFFDQGAYVDLSPVTSAINSVSNNVNLLKTTVDNLNCSGGSSGTVDFTSLYSRFDQLDTAIANIDLSSIDLSSVTQLINDNQSVLIGRFDNVDTEISNIGQIDASTIDLTNLQNAIIDTISQSVQDFIVGTSLNGASGSLYFDGSQVLVDGDNRIYTVLGSQILTTIGGQADYFYVLQDSQGRKMVTVQDNISLYVDNSGS